MSEVSRDKLFDRGVDLIIHQTDTVHSWLGRYVAVQAGIAVAVGAVISWRGNIVGWPITILLLLFAVLAMILAALMSEVVNRHLAWQRGYIGSVKRIEGKDPLLYTEDMVREDEGLRISHFFGVVKWVIGAAWAVFFVFVLVYQLCQWPLRG